MASALKSSDPQLLQCNFRLQILPEYFVDYFEVARKSTGGKVTTQPHLGLIDQLYPTDETDICPEGKTKTPWERFEGHIKRLNNDSGEHVTYKVIYLTRHGLGVHNLYETAVGRDAWNNHWSHLPGDGKLFWQDAKLVEPGIQQAKELALFWGAMAIDERAPLPERLYTSPLARCLETTRLVFSQLVEHSGRLFRPIVKELLRERLTDHTCDQRSTRSWIEYNYPSYVIENGFTEEDVLWRADRSESLDEHVARKHAVLEDIMSCDDSQFISLTTHSYALSAILRACGSGEFRIAEGSTVAFVVRAEKIA